MSKTCVEPRLTQDGVVFRIFESKPYGVPDIERFVAVSFDPCDIISPLTKELPFREDWYKGTQYFWVPRRNQWLAFHFSAYMERPIGPREEDVYGPYVASEAPPDENEVLEATQKGEFVTICKMT